MIEKHDHQGEDGPGYLYIAGPMTGIHDFNFSAFDAAAKRLRQKGWRVVNPAENFDGQQDLPWSVYLREAVKQVADSLGVVLLDGWEQSEGVALELTIARALNLPIKYLSEYEDD